MKSKLVSKLSKFLATSSLLVVFFSNSDINANQIPTSLKITLYELGFRDSTTGNLNSVINDGSGNTKMHLVTDKGKGRDLTNGLQVPSEGTFDQLYFITSNNPIVSGNNGSGCYIKQGTYTYNDGVVVGAATTNSALAATVSNPASITETGLRGSDFYGPVTPIVTSSVNGTETDNMQLLLVNSMNKTIAPYTRYLHYANLREPITIKKREEGHQLIITYNTDEAMGFSASEGGPGCDDFYWDKIRINLSIK